MNIQPFPTPRTDNPRMGTCSKCGMVLNRVMYYSCGRSNCPSGLGSRVTL